jgi:hypothetical protein
VKNTLLVALSASLWVGIAGFAMTGCHEEPPIVVKFQPNDLAPAHAAAAAPDAAPAAAAVDAATAEKAPAAEPPSAHVKAQCRVAADCTVAPLDCCDCANGGKQQAILKHDEARLEAARAKRCKHAMCTMMLSLDPTCGKRADCVEGRCVLVDKSGKGKAGSLGEKLKEKMKAPGEKK